MISTIEKVLFLKSIDLFGQIPGEDLARVAQIAQEVNFNDNEMFIKQGEDGDCLYLIAEGNVRILANEKEVARLGQKQCVGEMAILDNEPRSASVVAVGDVTALKIDRDDFYDLLRDKMEIAQGIIKVLTHRLREANARYNAWLKASAEAKIPPRETAGSKPQAPGAT